MAYVHGPHKVHRHTQFTMLAGSMRPIHFWRCACSSARHPFATTRFAGDWISRPTRFPFLKEETLMVRKTERLLMALALLAFTSITPAAAQQTSGNISGRVARSAGRCDPRRDGHRKESADRVHPHRVSDPEGLYRLSALPVGTYDLTVELQGFSTDRSQGRRRHRRADRRPRTSI